VNDPILDDIRVLIATIERGFDLDAYVAAIESGDDDRMGTTHPMLWLPEGAEDDGTLNAVHRAIKVVMAL
jgi:hypothetical protein